MVLRSELGVVCLLQYSSRGAHDLHTCPFGVCPGQRIREEIWHRINHKPGFAYLFASVHAPRYCRVPDKDGGHDAPVGDEPSVLSGIGLELQLCKSITTLCMYGSFCCMSVMY